MVLLEICTPTAASVLAAAAGGADRIELTAGLEIGGISPSLALTEFALKAFPGEVHVLVRPRPGDFIYSEAELRIMIDDISYYKKAGVHGVVFGALTAAGDIDIPAMSRLIDACGDTPFSFHRAIDHTRSILESTEILVSMGMTRILSSGGAQDSPHGLDTLTKMIRIAGERTRIMAGGGITVDNLHQVIMGSGVRDVHMSAKVNVSNKPYLVDQPGPVTKTGSFFGSDTGIIRQAKEIIDRINREGWTA